MRAAEPRGQGLLGRPAALPIQPPETYPRLAIDAMRRPSILVILLEARSSAMGLSFDPAKRAWTLRVRGLDFADVETIFALPVFTIEDKRYDYGEVRWLTYGLLGGRQVTVVWTWRGDDRHIISLRKSNDREKARYGPRMD